MSDDPNEQVYVRNETLSDGAWVARSALRQLSTQNWFEAEPPADSLRQATNLEDRDPDELVVIRHDGLDQAVQVPRSAVRQHSLSGWYVEGEAPVPPEPQPIVRDGEFDPTAHGYKDVVDHLKTADDAERARIVAVEQAQPNPRKSIIGWQPPADEDINHQEGQS